MLNPHNIGGPGDAFVAVGLLLICLLLGAFPVIKMIQWWADGTVEPGLAMVGIVILVGCAALITLLPIAFAMIILILFASLAISLPLVANASDKRGIQRIDDERFRLYTRQLEAEPMNHAVRMGLASMLRRRGDLADALAQYEWIQQASPGLTNRTRPEIDSIRREIERQGRPTLIICHRCQSENPYNAELCENCGVAFGTKLGMQQRMNYDGGPKVILRGMIVTFLAVTIVLFSILTMPIIIMAPVLLATLIVALWLFLRWVGGDMGTVGE